MQACTLAGHESPHENVHMCTCMYACMSVHVMHTCGAFALDVLPVVALACELPTDAA
jgi:hypothetical protein